MDKNYIECLEHIIEIEKTCYTQEKLLASLNKTIDTLGIPQNISMPQKIHTYVPPVEYSLVSGEELEVEDIKGLAFVGAIIVGIIGFFVGNALDFIWTGIIGGIMIGAMLGGLCGLAINAFNDSKAQNVNEKLIKEAQEKTEKLTIEQKRIDEQRYQNDLKKYNALVAFEKNRVILENEKKKELFCTKEELIEKHKESQKLLANFYDFANIYETYRNIVAICYIYEYLKSGVCEQLTGRDGAYMIFKYEMYEKLKIEKLDTIVSKLDQLHFDNITLNSTMQKINSKCDDLISEIRDMRTEQAEAAERSEALINNLGSRIDSAAEHISYQNAVVAYNQECATNELKQIKWLTAMERR